MIADPFSVLKTTFLTIRKQQTFAHITKVRGGNSLKKITGDLKPSEQIIYRNDSLGAPVQCNRCNLQYIGETKRRLKDRFNEHRRTIDNPNSW